MPELPEVETIRRILQNGTVEVPSLIGQTISDVSLFWSRSLATPSPEVFAAFLKGNSIIALDRRGKFLIIILEKGYLVFHLRMSGDLRIASEIGSTRLEESILTHDRAYLHFESGYGLAFNDTRKFGRIWLTPDLQSVLKGLGPEPFDPNLTTDRFFNKLHAAKRQLKPLLLDQHFLAGLGNIYTDEALFLAGVHPKRSSHSLSISEADKLLGSIRNVLELGISNNGASIDWVYRGGNFQNHFNVYQQTGNPCPTCGTPIERTTVGQRGTHFCPHCQPQMKERNNNVR